ncbi:MAG: hypothetical protein J5765_03710 [Clostridia bacterium]|nr:hypothetical protein [Clostridia bacterium]
MTFYDDITDNESKEEVSPAESTEPTDPPAEKPIENDAKVEPANEPASEPAPETDAGTPAPTAGRLVAKGSGNKSYRTGTKIAAFIFFIITAGIFALYEYLAFTFLYLPLMESIDNLGEAFAAIFAYIFGLIYTLIFAVAQLPANIVTIILFKRLRGKSDKKWENVLFTVFFALAIVMLLVTVISTLLFFGMSALGG